jgi:hypothetical protein
MIVCGPVGRVDLLTLEELLSLVKVGVAGRVFCACY